jgi:hypothetical protein
MTLECDTSTVIANERTELISALIPRKVHQVQTVHSPSWALPIQISKRISLKSFIDTVRVYRRN